MRTWLFFLLVPVLLMSCYSTEIEEAAPRLVVEGWIDGGRFPVVQLTTTVPISKRKQSIDSLDRFIVKWARVAVSDGSKEVVLTGMYDERYYPPYIYTTSDLRGETGKTYILQVDYGQFHACAETTIPTPVDIDSFSVSPIYGDSIMYTVKAFFHDDPRQTDYYRFFINTDSSAYTMRGAYLGTFNDRAIGEYAKVTVNNGRNNLVHPQPSPYFDEGDVVRIKFCHIDSVGYRFWKAYEDYNSEGRNPMFNAMQNLPSNVNGALGYWLGYGARYYRLPIVHGK